MLFSRCPIKTASLLLVTSLTIIFVSISRPQKLPLLLGGGNHETASASTSQFSPIPARTQSCGEKSMFVILSADGRNLPYGEVVSRFAARNASRESSLLDIRRVAMSYGYSAEAVQTDFDYLSRWLELPRHYAILHCKDRHFSPAIRSVSGTILMCDLSVGAECVSAQDLVAGRYSWNGNAVLVHVGEDI